MVFQLSFFFFWLSDEGLAHAHGQHASFMFAFNEVQCEGLKIMTI